MNVPKTLERLHSSLSIDLDNIDIALNGEAGEHDGLNTYQLGTEEWECAKEVLELLNDTIKDVRTTLKAIQAEVQDE